MYPNTDPRSWNYIRKYNKPKINFVNLFLSIIVIVFWSVILYVLISKTYNIKIAIIFVLVFDVMIILLFAKQILILFVKLYQNLAPISIRKNCRFEPSCSDYMILAIEKYGALKGTLKGFNRIYRCSTGDGGFDDV